MSDRIGKYLSVEKLQKPASQKTDEWMVVPNSGGCIATIEWYSPWRQYCLFPDQEAVFNNACLLDIAVFLQAKTEERKTHWMSHKGDRRRG